jgi:hypothetical protein
MTNFLFSIFILNILQKLICFLKYIYSMLFPEGNSQPQHGVDERKRKREEEEGNSHKRRRTRSDILKDELVDMRAELKRMQKDLDNTRSELEQTREMHEIHTSVLHDSLDGAFRSREEDRIALQAERVLVDMARDDRDEALGELELANQECESLRAERDEAREELELANQERESLRAEHDKLKNDFAHLLRCSLSFVESVGWVDPITLEGYEPEGITSEEVRDIAQAHAHYLFQFSINFLNLPQ